MAKKPTGPRARLSAADIKRIKEAAATESRNAQAARQELVPIVGTGIVPDARYNERSLRAYGQGPWKDESTKVAWTDPATGYADEQQEFLLAVLVAIDRTVDSASEAAKDLFGGNWDKAAHYGMWLEGHGLIKEANWLGNARMTPEGRAIMAMLMATRDPALIAKPIGLGSLATYAGMRPEPDREAMEAAIAKAEASLPPMPIAFARHTVARMPAVVLIGPARSRIAINETIWALQFDGEHERDLFYRWLLIRADRWEDWMQIVQQQGAQALTRRFLTLRIAEEAEKRGE